ILFPSEETAMPVPVRSPASQAAPDALPPRAMQTSRVEQVMRADPLGSFWKAISTEDWDSFLWHSSLFPSPPPQQAARSHPVTRGLARRNLVDVDTNLVEAVGLNRSPLAVWAIRMV